MPRPAGDAGAARAVVFDGAVICRLPSADEWAEFAAAADLTIDEFIRFYLYTVNSTSHIDDDVVSLARKLKRSGITTGILSNMPPALLARLRCGSAWLDAF